MLKTINTEITEYLNSKPILKLYLFGSFSRNEETEYSDIDLLVEIDNTKKADLFDFIGWQWDLEKLFGKKVDLVSTDNISKFIKPYIDRDKILIYEKK